MQRREHEVDSREPGGLAAEYRLAYWPYYLFNSLFIHSFIRHRVGRVLAAPANDMQQTGLPKLADQKST